MCTAAKKRERARGISAIGAQCSVSPICLPHAIKLEQYTGASFTLEYNLVLFEFKYSKLKKSFGDKEERGEGRSRLEIGTRA